MDGHQKHQTEESMNAAHDCSGEELESDDDKEDDVENLLQENEINISWRSPVISESINTVNILKNQNVQHRWQLIEKGGTQCAKRF